MLAFSTVAISASRSPPVVPITNGSPCFAYHSEFGLTAIGRVKSMQTAWGYSAARRAATSSAPSDSYIFTATGEPPLPSSTLSSPPHFGPVNPNGTSSTPRRKQAEAISRPMAPGRPLIITAIFGAPAALMATNPVTTVGSAKSIMVCSA
jgi:hypothetical protein